MKFYWILIWGCFSISTLQAKIWYVGPGKTYTKPSQVSTLVADGDTIEIDAATYESDVARWSANNLVIKGVGGKAHLKANGNSYGQKAIWVIAGNNTTVENIEFSLCTVPDHNGAGIRQEGKNLIVRYCYFHHNEDGILAGTVNPSNITIEFSEFGYNGYGDGLSHNLYINNIDTLVFRFNYSHHASVGHELKSRAHVNYIMYNRITDEATSTSSRNIDLPNGGTTYLIGNVIEQGPESENSNIIGYGLEGLNNPGSHEFYAINNTIVNNRVSGNFFNFQTGTALFKCYNNILAGPGVFILGTYPVSVETVSNIIDEDIEGFDFTDAANYDYHITANTITAINTGVAPGMANSVNLSPEFEYLHPSDSTLRCQNGALDIGAFEYCVNSSVVENSFRSLSIYPNPVIDIAYIDLPKNGPSLLQLYNGLGQLLMYKFIDNKVDLSTLNSGIYFINIRNGDAEWVSGVVKL